MDLPEILGFREARGTVRFVSRNGRIPQDPAWVADARALDHVVLTCVREKA